MLVQYLSKALFNGLKLRVHEIVSSSRIRLIALSVFLFSIPFVTKLIYMVPRFGPTAQVLLLVDHFRLIRDSSTSEKSFSNPEFLSWVRFRETPFVNSER